MRLLFVFTLLFIFSCSSSQKGKDDLYSYDVNTCLYYKGYQVMIIEWLDKDYRLFYDFGDTSYVAIESKHFVKTRMIPIKCKKGIYKKMDLFI